MTPCVLYHWPKITNVTKGLLNVKLEQGRLFGLIYIFYDILNFELDLALKFLDFVLEKKNSYCIF
jgi:hypothetical protein